MITAIFFDIGGTLRIPDEAQGRDLEKLNRLKDLLNLDCSLEELDARIRKGEKDYRRWCKPNFIELDERGLWTRFLMPDLPRVYILENAVMFNQLWRESKPKKVLPDMVETMKSLYARGYKLGLISNTTSSIEAYQMLEETGLTSLFSAVILSAAYGKRKPDPSLFVAAARQAGVDPRACAYVGDRPSRDLLGSRQANFSECTIINVFSNSVDPNDPDDYDPDKDEELDMRPDHFITSLSQLLDFYPDITRNAPRASTPQEPLVYDAALSTMWNVDQTADFNQTFELARGIGLARFELNHKVNPALLAEFNRDRYYVSTVHDPCPAEMLLEDLKKEDILISSLEEIRRKRSVEMTLRTIDLAHHLGARSVVIHPGTVISPSTHDRQLRKLFKAGQYGSVEYEEIKAAMIAERAQLAGAHLQQVRTSLLEIIPFAREKKIAIGLENRYRYFDIPLPYELDELLSLSSEYWYGFQFDCGHAQALDRLGLVPMMDWLERVGSRMVGCHLHDVQGIVDHQAPGLGDVDFHRIAPYIPENACRTLEIGPQATLTELADGLEILAESGCIKRL